jgi:hypothetical protein
LWGSQSWLRAGLLAGFLRAVEFEIKPAKDAGLQAGLPAPHQFTRSMIVAVAIPKPMHIDCKP